MSMSSQTVRKSSTTAGTTSETSSGKPALATSGVEELGVSVSFQTFLYFLLCDVLKGADVMGVE